MRKWLTFQSLTVTLRTTQFKFQKLYMVLTLYAFVVYESQNLSFYNISSFVIHNGGGDCLLRGTQCVLI